MDFEFLIPKRPVSLQTKNRHNLQAWKNFVRAEASKTWFEPPSQTGTNIHITLVYLCDEAPVDTDNIVKPIQDALIGLVYTDDQDVTDIESHRRPLSGTFDLTELPDLLTRGLSQGDECVYVHIQESKPLEVYL